MDYTHLMVIFSSVLIVNSAFFSFYLLFGVKKDNRTKRLHVLLALLLIAFMLRVTKSVVYVLFPEYSGELTSLGIIGMLLIGPLYWFYYNSIYNIRDGRLFHFVPSVLLIASLPFFKSEMLWVLYLISLVHMLVYYIKTLLFYNEYKSKNTLVIKENKWLKALSVGFFLLWVGFLLQAFVYSKYYYLGITFSEVIIFFVLTFIAFKNYKDLSKQYKPNRAYAEYKKILDLALNLLKSEELYLDNNLTLELLAKQVGTNSHILSKVLNEVKDMSFPELLNYYRIEHSKELLIANSNLSIEGIAYESGFNSLSTFYSNFKKLNNTTPFNYRANFMKKVM